SRVMWPVAPLLERHPVTFEYTLCYFWLIICRSWSSERSREALVKWHVSTNLVYGFVVGGVFVQAEDGIRDWSVTGVQTCSLPIELHSPAGRARRSGDLSGGGAASQLSPRGGGARRHTVGRHPPRPPHRARYGSRAAD